MGFTPKKSLKFKAKEVLSKKLKYVDLDCVEELLEKYSPISSNMLAYIIDEALDNINQGYTVTTSRNKFKNENPKESIYITGSIDKLLKHNKSKKNTHGIIVELNSVCMYY